MSTTPKRQLRQGLINLKQALSKKEEGKSNTAPLQETIL
jgi:hypothetical protein